MAHLSAHPTSSALDLVTTGEIAVAPLAGVWETVLAEAPWELAGGGAQQKKRATDAGGDGMTCMLAAGLPRPLRRRLGAHSDNPPPDCSRRR